MALTFVIALVAAQLGSIFGFVVVAGLSMFLLGQRRYREIVVLLLLVLFFGDSRAAFLEPVKALRVPLVVVLAVFAGLRILDKGLQRPLLFFLGVVAASLVAVQRSPEPSAAALKTISYLLLVVVVCYFIAPILRFDPRGVAHDLMRLYATLLFAGLVLIPVAPNLVFFGATTGPRFRGLLGNPDGLGLTSALLLPLQFAWLDVGPKRDRRLVFWTIAATFLGIVLSGSRNGLASFGIIMVLRVARRLSRGVRAVLLVAAILLGTYAVDAVDLTSLSTDSFAGRLVRPQTLETGGGRFFAWAYALTYVGSSPVVGHGFGFADLIFDEEHRTTVFTDRGGHQGGVHNGYLGLLLDTGAVGLVCYLSFVVALVRQTKGARFLVPTLVVAAWTSIFENWAGGSLNAHTIIFLSEVVLISALYRDHFRSQTASAAEEGTTALAGSASVDSAAVFTA